MTIRIALGSVGARRVDLILNLVAAQRREIQGVESLHSRGKALSGLVTGALLACFQKIDEICHFGASFRRQRLQLLNQVGLGIGVHDWNSLYDGLCTSPERSAPCSRS